MKDIRFKQGCNIWSVMIGYSGGKKSVQYKTLNENLKMLIKNKSYSRKRSESYLRDLFLRNETMEATKKIPNELMSDGFSLVFSHEFNTVLGNLDNTGKLPI